MNVKQAIYYILQQFKKPKMKWHMFEVTFNAVAGGNTVLVGTLNDYAPSGYNFVGGLMPFVLNGIDTTIFNNAPEYMIYDGKLYIKTYKAANNVKIQFYGIVAK